MGKIVRAAAAQMAPIWMDREATVDKACRLIAEGGAAGATLIAFPECFIPTYPLWVWFIPAGETATLRDLYDQLLTQAVTIPSETTARLGEAARYFRRVYWGASGSTFGWPLLHGTWTVRASLPGW